MQDIISNNKINIYLPIIELKIRQSSVMIWLENTKTALSKRLFWDEIFDVLEIRTQIVFFIELIEYFNDFIGSVYYLDDVNIPTANILEVIQERSPHPVY